MRMGIEEVKHELSGFVYNNMQKYDTEVEFYFSDQNVWIYATYSNENKGYSLNVNMAHPTYDEVVYTIFIPYEKYDIVPDFSLKDFDQMAEVIFNSSKLARNEAKAVAKARKHTA